LNSARDSEEIKSLLSRGLQELGYAPEPERLSMFMTCLAELKKWNRAYNLTGIKKDADMVIKHLLDSLLYLQAVPEGCGTVADIGSGAGFPGIPVKIMRPDIRVYLIEPSGKKAAFLRHVSRRLRIEDVQVIEKRIESTQIGEDIPEQVDVAMTRALFDIGTFVKKVSHIVRKGGICIVNKGPRVKEEIDLIGNMRFEMLTLPLPLTKIKRHIVVVPVP
jgi:16S rRNA (guanine527-N7)-methyltransferase